MVWIATRSNLSVLKYKEANKAIKRIVCFSILFQLFKSTMGYGMNTYTSRRNLKKCQSPMAQIKIQLAYRRAAPGHLHLPCSPMEDWGTAVTTGDPAHGAAHDIIRPACSGEGLLRNGVVPSQLSLSNAGAPQLHYSSQLSLSLQGRGKFDRVQP